MLSANPANFVMTTALAECDSDCASHGGGECSCGAWLFGPRALQVQRVIPLIGPLIDAWEGIPNDTKGGMRADAPTLCDYLDRVTAATREA